MFASSPNPNFQAIGTEQVRQVLRESLTVAAHGEKDRVVSEFFYTLFHTGQSFVEQGNESRLLQTVRIAAQRRSLAMSDIITPSVLED